MGYPLRRRMFLHGARLRPRNMPWTLRRRGASTFEMRPETTARRTIVTGNRRFYRRFAWVLNLGGRTLVLG